jgi:RNA polymerase sigma factor (sigma-70 family)
MSRLARSEASAFEEILAQHWSGVALFAARLLNDREAARDVAQETFIRLWIGRMRWHAAFLRPLLYRVARNLVADELRKRSVRARWEGSLSEPHEEADPEDFSHEQELHAHVARAVEALAPRRRQALTLAFLHELPYKEVAAVMGISVATVRNSISTALSDLRGSLAPHHRHCPDDGTENDEAR